MYSRRVEWNSERLEATLATMRRRGGDSATVEVKRAHGGLPKDIGSTLSAFANMPDGGTIILGADEGENFAITGLEDPVAIEQKIVDIARKAISPSPYLSTEIIESPEGKKVLIAEVAPLRVIDKPALWKGKAYLRQADGDYAMHEHELRMLEVEKLHSTERIEYDKEELTETNPDDLVPTLTHAYLAAARQRSPRLAELDDNQILRLTGVVGARGKLTMAGLYALGMYPQGVLPPLSVTAAVQLRNNSFGARTLNLKHFDGPIPMMLEDIMVWFQQNLGTIQRYRSDGHMVSEPEIPLVAIRELVTNALVHRDLGPNTLGTGKSIQIRLLPDRLIIQSPGGLRGISLEQLESINEHAQAAVNQHLYAIAKNIRTSSGASLIEGEGGGIRQVFNQLAEHGLNKPELINTGVQFTAIIMRQLTDTPPAVETANPNPKGQQPTLENGAINTAHSITRNAPAIITALSNSFNSSGTLADLKSKTQLSRGQLHYALDRLIDKGIVQRVGAQGNRATFYKLISPPG